MLIRKVALRNTTMMLSSLAFALSLLVVIVRYVVVVGTCDLLDIDGGEIDDEVRFHVVLGSSFGDGEGVDSFAEGIYRDATATVDDLELKDPVSFDLEGPRAEGVNHLALLVGVIERTPSRNVSRQLDRPWSDTASGGNATQHSRS